MKLLLSYLLLICFAGLAVAPIAKTKGTTVVRNEDEPAPMLTPDYGIVTEEDRHKDERGPIPFLPAPEDGLFYWQCLKVDKVIANCIGIDRATIGMGCRKYSCLPDIEVLSEDSRYIFQGHKGWCLENYREFAVKLKKLLRGEDIACFGGEYLGENPIEHPSEKRSSSWFLKRVKTRRGKWSYFVD